MYNILKVLYWGSSEVWNSIQYYSDGIFESNILFNSSWIYTKIKLANYVIEIPFTYIFLLLVLFTWQFLERHVPMLSTEDTILLNFLFRTVWECVLCHIDVQKALSVKNF